MDDVHVKYTLKCDWLLLLFLLFAIIYPGWPLQFCWTVINEGPAFLAKHLQRSLIIRRNIIYKEINFWSRLLDSFILSHSKDSWSFSFSVKVNSIIISESGNKEGDWPWTFYARSIKETVHSVKDDKHFNRLDVFLSNISHQDTLP